MSFSRADMVQLASLLQNAQKQMVFTECELSISGVRTIPQSHPEYEYNIERLEACREFKTRWPYDPAFSYDLGFLMRTTLEAIYQAQQEGKEVVVLKNTCCSDNEKCPQMDFRRLFIERLKEEETT